MVRTCSIDGQPVDYKDLAKAYETESGQVVIMEEQDFEGLPVPGVREIEVLEFVPAEQVDPVLFDRSYYLEPEARALKPYVLLREALSQTDRMALVRVVLRQKSQLAALRVRGDVLVMQTMLWPDEVREPEFDILDADVDLRPQELTMAASLVESLGADFDPSQFHDEYRDAVVELIERKRTTGETRPAPVAEKPTDDGDSMTDLLSALQASVEAARAAAGQKDAPAEEPPAKKPAARKSSKKSDDKSESTTRRRTRKPA